MNGYVDTSALVAIYVTEVRSRVAGLEARAAGQLPFTPLQELEPGNALQLPRGRRLLDDRQLQQVSAPVEEDRDAARLVDTVVDLHRVCDRARALSAAHPGRSRCRSLDVLHVAAALELGCRRFVAGGERQLALARALGRDIVDIKARRRRRRP